MRLILFRTFSSSTRKADFVKKWNRENKQLFGTVVKPKKKKEVKKSEIQQPPAISSNANSERFWVTGSGNSKTFPTQKAEVAASTASARNEKIPFDDQGLRDLLKFPLMNYGNELGVVNITDYPCAQMPSVGRILQATMPDAARSALEAWKLKKIEELGEEGFMALQKDNLAKGTAFHGLLQNYFSTREVPTTDNPDYEIWKSVSNILPKVSPDAIFVEQALVHPQLKYKGIVDCVSRIGSDVFAIEWKRSEKAKPSIAATYDAPLQLCAYLGALNRNPSYNVAINRGIVVVAYTNGRPADFFQLAEPELERYWRAWLLRLQEYWIRCRDGTLPASG